MAGREPQVPDGRDDEDSRTVAVRMAAAGMLRLPVVDRRNHVVGFVTLRRATAIGRAGGMTGAAPTH